MHVGRRQVIALLEHRKGTPETGVSLDGKRDEVHKCGDSHCRHSGNQNEYPCHWSPSQCCRDRNPHHHHCTELFRPTREPHQACAFPEWLVAHVVLHRMSDFVGGNCHSCEGFPTEVIV